MERLLSSTVDATVGEAGRFDLLVQVHHDRRREALAAVDDLLRRTFPGAAVQEGPSAAGSTVLLVSLSSRWRGASAFERLEQELPSLPGYVSWVPLVEPAIVISRLHPALADDLEGWLSGRPEVAFSFVHGSDRVVVLSDAAGLDGFEDALEAYLDRYRVVRITTPGQVVDRESARRAAQAVTEASWPVTVVEAAPASEGDGAEAARWVGRMRDFFFAYATLARVEPSAGLDPPLQEGEQVLVGDWPARIVAQAGEHWLAVLSDEALTSDQLGPTLGQELPVRRPSGQQVGQGIVDGGQARIDAALRQSEELLARLQTLGSAGQEALDAARVAVDGLEQAAGRLERMLNDLQQLASTASDPLRDTLLALGLSMLLGGEPGDAPQQAVDYVASLRQQLDRLQEQLREYRQGDLPAVQASVRSLRESLPRLGGTEIASALHVLQQAGADPLAAAAGVELVLRGERFPSPSAIGGVVGRALQLDQSRVYVSPAAVASPSARAAVMRVAQRAGVVGAALAMGALVLWTLFNDGAAVAALVQTARRGRAGRLSRDAWRVAALGALVGGLLALGAGVLALGVQEVLILLVLAGVGVAAGLVAGRWGPRLAPVDADAVEAALAMGMEAGAILEGVVAPSVRPWLLALTASRRPPRAPASAATEAAGDESRTAALTASIEERRRAGVHEPTEGAERGPVVLEAEGLVRHFGGRPVLDGVSLSVARGETVILMGPSGCGKSTLLRCLKGLIQPDAGRVRIEGEDLWALPEARRRDLAARVAMVFQRPQLVGHLSVLENTALGAASAGIPWPEAYERAAMWLSALELGRHLDRRPAELSGGEGQRVAIARALAAQPSVVLWDEPTSHLDPMLAADLLQLMEELIGRLRTTMLVVTHQPGFTARVGDRLILMDRGQVVESGPPARVLARPTSEVGRRLARLAVA